MRAECLIDLALYLFVLDGAFDDEVEVAELLECIDGLDAAQRFLAAPDCH